MITVKALNYFVVHGRRKFGLLTVQLADDVYMKFGIEVKTEYFPSFQIICVRRGTCKPGISNFIL
jgi:hypothetical protein